MLLTGLIQQQQSLRMPYQPSIIAGVPLELLVESTFISLLVYYTPLCPYNETIFPRLVDIPVDKILIIQQEEPSRLVDIPRSFPTFSQDPNLYYIGVPTMWGPQDS